MVLAARAYAPTLPSSAAEKDRVLKELPLYDPTAVTVGSCSAGAYASSALGASGEPAAAISAMPMVTPVSAEPVHGGALSTLVETNAAVTDARDRAGEAGVAKKKACMASLPTKASNGWR